jgi:hypothetical protein
MALFRSRVKLDNENGGMNTYDAIYDNGMLRLPGPLPLPNSTTVRVTIDIPQELLSTPDSPKGAPTGSLERIYELLSQGADTGIPDLAARHNEHQP